MTLAAWAIGNIIGAEVFLPKYAPLYILGKTVVLVMISTSLLRSFVLRWFNRDLNIKKNKELLRLKEENDWTDEDVERERQRHAFLDMKDRE